MRKLFLILALPALLSAQTYSRWNYSTATPNNTTADAKLIADFSAMMTNHATGDLRIHVRYTYTGSDSSFEVPDIEQHLIRVFEPTPAPDGATEAVRENEVVVLTKHSPLKSQTMKGGDGILPKGQAIGKAGKEIVQQAKAQAKLMREMVKAEMRADKKLKRKDAWLKVKADKKAEKEAKQNDNKLDKK